MSRLRDKKASRDMVRDMVCSCHYDVSSDNCHDNQTESEMTTRAIARKTTIDELDAQDRNKIRVDEATDCWLWTAYCDPQGYGAARRYLKTMKAHRYIYELFKGELTDNQQLDHTCGVRRCVNPAHLETVTTQVNVWRGLAARNQQEIPADLAAEVMKLVGRAYRQGYRDGVNDAMAMPPPGGSHDERR